MFHAEFKSSFGITILPCSGEAALHSFITQETASLDNSYQYLVRGSAAGICRGLGIPPTYLHTLPDL